MHLGEISFCDRTAYNIKCDDTKANILNRFESNYGISIVRKHHQRYTDDIVPTLNSSPYLVSLRTNGNPYLLYLTKHNGVNTCIFIDKKIQHGYFYPRMILTKMWFDDELFNDTLFDGEMVKYASGKWMYFLNDIIVDSCIHLTHINLVRRIERMRYIMTHKYIHDIVVPFDITTKQYFEYHDLETIVSSVATLPYTCRGIYFKPLHLKFKDVLLNFDDSVVVKVTKTRYRDNGNFLTSTSDVNESINVNVGNDVTKIDLPKYNAFQERVNFTNQYNENSDSIDTTIHQLCTNPAPSIVHCAEKAFQIRKTAVPDVYEIFDMDMDKKMQSRSQFQTKTTSGQNHMTACVNKLSTSEMLYNVFLNKNLLDTVPFMCQFSSKFGKWVPVASLAKDC